MAAFLYQNILIVYQNVDYEIWKRCGPVEGPMISQTIVYHLGVFQMETRYTIDTDTEYDCPTLHYFEYPSLDGFLFISDTTDECLTTTLPEDYILGVF